MQVAPLWIILGLGIELIMLALISYAFFTWKKRKLPLSLKSDVELLEKQVSQADALSGRIYKELSGRLSEFKELFQDLEHKEEQFNELISRVEEALMGLDFNAGGVSMKTRLEKYHDVIKLNEKGFSRNEISKRTGIVGNEIDLVLRMRTDGGTEG